MPKRRNHTLFHLYFVQSRQICETERLVHILELRIMEDNEKSRRDGK